MTTENLSQKEASLENQKGNIKATDAQSKSPIESSEVSKKVESKVEDQQKLNSVQLLSHEEKLRIKQEEIFRREVQEELKKEQTKTRWEQVGEIVNKPFIIWLLSSVVLAVISWQYQSWQESAKKTKEWNLEVDRQAEELKYRVINFQRKFPDLRERVDKLEKASREDLYAEGEKVLALLRESDKDFLFPQYSSWSLRAILQDIAIKESAEGMDTSGLSGALGAMLYVQDARSDLEREILEKDNFKEVKIKEAIRTVFVMAHVLDDSLKNSANKTTPTPAPNNSFNPSPR